ncbi:ferredoxin--NADP reductase [Allomuricauda sp. SCSIO 65647]|uniref:ferredoxin--NADP reductase n=1 Tax=Allomuricauda sp. SCSIO 65647 TaxID=2908843 RepID=UPI001F26C2D5|nr:ferredoxin--NADP reductase [Muricauda sp. SCSIO 65647]UJH69025.1 ferredoxin--NADP reductase [Muricauda sp. SCSIO 65647]
MSEFYPLKVAQVERLTANAVSLSFEIPENLKSVFSFKAGQYITLKHRLNGEEVRRAYSISCAPGSEKITVGVKKMLNGAFSVYANEHIKSGDTFEVMPPEGRFVFEPGNEAKNIAAFAAGSGITPIMSIAETVLTGHPDNTFLLVFGNQSPEEVMYAQKIDALKQKYNDQFFLQHIFSRTPGDDALFGRIETSTVNFALKNKFKHVEFDAYYLCGPEEMINTVSDTLKKNGVSDHAIFFELFTPSEVVDTLAENLSGKTQVEVLLDDEVHALTMDKKELVLDAVLKANIDAPYSCQGGVCSSCVARVTEGKVEMVKNQILTDGEVAEGLVLTCQSHPVTPKLKIDYDDV